MITVIPKTQDAYIEVFMQGEIDEQDYQKVNEQMSLLKSKEGKVNMLLEIKDFKWDSVEAMLKDFQISLDYYKDFHKIAIVTDKEWLEMVESVFDKLTPSIKLQSFEVENKEAASAWMKS